MSLANNLGGHSTEVSASTNKVCFHCSHVDDLLLIDFYDVTKIKLMKKANLSKSCLMLNKEAIYIQVMFEVT